LDTEWLLSTLFDASLLSTSKAAGNGGSFFVRSSMSSIQPDGDEGSAKRKGRHRGWGPNKAMEQGRGPMGKYRITGPTGRTSEQMIAKSMVVKGRGGKSGGRTVTAVGPYPDCTRVIALRRSLAPPFGNHKSPCRWTLPPTRAMICSS